ncbi:MAG: DUF4339 domain-containing protein [Verrucomicrobiae bacterium]|nr:DUF4339 domain-containing protein [Verrucomicrobiae bacterium]
MDRITKFYYADHSGNPVGPLTLGEIRKFANAGVIPHDVMICEAGGETWRSLNTIGEPPTPLSQPSPEPISSPPCSKEASPAQKVRTLKIVYTATVIVSLIAFFLSTTSDRTSVQAGDPYASQGAGDSLLVILTLLSMAGSVALIYFLVISLPERHRFASPIKAAGFFLIPVFSIYWVFKLLPGLVNSTREWWAETAPEKPRRLMWLVPFAVITASIMAMGGVFDLLYNFVWLTGDLPSDGWEGILFFSGLTYAFSEATFFQFTLSLIHILRALIDPEDIAREEERAKRTPFWKFRRRPWNPELYAWLFPVVFFKIWMVRVPH